MNQHNFCSFVHLWPAIYHYNVVTCNVSPACWKYPVIFWQDINLSGGFKESSRRNQCSQRHVSHLTRQGVFLEAHLTARRQQVQAHVLYSLFIWLYAWHKMIVMKVLVVMMGMIIWWILIKDDWLFYWFCFYFTICFPFILLLPFREHKFLLVLLTDIATLLGHLVMF